MTTSTAVLITTRDALVRLGWLDPGGDTVPTNLRKRLLALCAAKRIIVEQFEEGGPMWVSAPQLDAYIASLGAVSIDIEAIRARHVADASATMADFTGYAAYLDRGALLAEVDRITTELAEIKEALVEVAGSIPRWSFQPGIGLLIGSGTVWFEATPSVDATLRRLGFEATS